MMDNPTKISEVNRRMFELGMGIYTLRRGHKHFFIRRNLFGEYDYGRKDEKGNSIIIDVLRISDHTMSEWMEIVKKNIHDKFYLYDNEYVLRDTE